MKKLNIFLVLFLITTTIFYSNAQIQVQIGSATTNSNKYGPTNISASGTTTDYARYNYLYLQSELASIPIGAQITKIEWQKYDAYAINGAFEFNVWLKNSASTNLVNNTTWGAAKSGATQVIANTSQLISATTGWIEFPLTSTFFYTGGGMEILTDLNTSGISGLVATGKISWYYSTLAFNGTIGYATYNPLTDATTLLTSTTYGGLVRPNIRITYQENKAMVVDSSKTIQATTSPIGGTASQQEIIGLEIMTSGNQNLLDVSSVSFNTNGTTNTADIAKAQLFYTTTPVFSNTVQLGSDILTPNGSFTFSFANKTLATGGNYFWLTYDIASSTADGNIVDAECTSYTLSTVAKTPSITNPGSGRIVYLPLSGVKTINSNLPASASNCQSFTVAAERLNIAGITGPVTFNVADGLYNEQISLSQINGASFYNPIVFQSANGNPDSVILEYTPTSSNNYVIQLDGTDYISFKNMTLQVVSAGSYACVISGSGICDSVMFYGNKINGKSNPSTGTAYANIYFASGTGNSINYACIQNNIISNGSYGIYLGGVSSSVWAYGSKVIGNTITNFYTHGIYAIYQDSIKIEDNVMSGVSVSATNQYGIYMSYCNNSSTALRNKMSVNAGTSIYGIYDNYCKGQAGQEILIANNFITVGNQSSTAYGLYCYYGLYQKIYHNSINIYPGPSTAGQGMYFTRSTSGTYGNIDVRNNISVNTAGGYAVNIQPNAVNYGYISIMDNNNYYVTGAYIGTYNGTDIADLTAWKAVWSNDTNSKSVDPMFISSTDLHINNNNNLSACGSATTGITDDIDGDLRAAIPCIGADEFAVVLPQAGLWKGTVSTDWSVAGNWDDNTVPLATVNVEILSSAVNQPHITSAMSAPAVCMDLTINSGAVLTIDAGKALTVNGQLTNNAGTSALVLKSDATGTASLLHTTLFVDAKVECYIPHTNTDEFHMLASPVAFQAIAPDFNEPDGFYAWNEANGTFVEYADAANFIAANGGINFVPGKGYAVSYPAVTTKSFIGSLNQGIIYIPLSVTAGNYSGWNFMANPYPSSVSWDASGWSRFNLADAGGSESAMWIWNAAMGNYGTYISNAGSGTGTNGVTADIPISQGFWVNAISSGALGMNDNVRIHSTQAFLKSASTSDRLRLVVTSTANTYRDEIIVKFGNANDLGGAPKMFSMDATAPNLYSSKLNKNWSINYLTTIAEHNIVPVGFKAGVSGNYTIHASEVNSFTTPTYVYLKDLAGNTLTDLNQNADYTFAATTNDNANRFQLLFAASPLAISNNVNENTSIYSFDKTIYINSNENIHEISIYNALGQMVRSIAAISGTKNINMNDYATGSYIVRVVTNKNVYTQKIMLD